MKTNYIVAFWGGDRRGQPSPTPIELFVNNHINFLKQNPKGIDYATFVFNKSDNPNDQKAIDLAKQAVLPTPHKVIVRENKNLSYGAWGEAMKQTHQDFDYSFLIEDDYVPVHNEFLDFFKQKVEDNVIFVASLFATSNGKHAAISNGLFVHKHINPENPVSLPPRRPIPYYGAAQDQIHFLRQYQNQDLIINDITNIAYTIFKSHNRYVSYPKNPIRRPLLIKPHCYDSSKPIN